jgi:hypothetical protein
MKKVGLLRVSLLDEIIGLDVAEMGHDFEQIFGHVEKMIAKKNTMKSLSPNIRSPSK